MELERNRIQGSRPQTIFDTTPEWESEEVEDRPFLLLWTTIQAMISSKIPRQGETWEDTPIGEEQHSKGDACLIELYYNNCWKNHYYLSFLLCHGIDLICHLDLWFIMYPIFICLYKRWFMKFKSKDSKLRNNLQ